MAKSRKFRSTRRDASVIASGRPRQLLGLSTIWRDHEDRRQFNPGVKWPQAVWKTPRVTMRPKAAKARARSSGPSLFHGPEVHTFDVPRSTMICVRRNQRKEVLHAKGVAGSKVRRPKRNAWSGVSCKRRK